MFKFMMGVCRVVQLRVCVCDKKMALSCHSPSYYHQDCPVTRVSRELCIKLVSVLGPCEGIAKCTEYVVGSGDPVLDKTVNG